MFSSKRRFTRTLKRILMPALLAFALAGCSPEKPKRTNVEADIRQLLKDKRVSVVSTAGYHQSNEIHACKIENEYTRKIEDETWIVYDVIAVLGTLSGDYDYKGMIGYVKRGEKWYLRELSASTRSHLGLPE
jgi:hypothetical protein